MKIDSGLNMHTGETNIVIYIEGYPEIWRTLEEACELSVKLSRVCALALDRANSKTTYDENGVPNNGRQ